MNNEKPKIPVLLFHRVVSEKVNEWTDISIEDFTMTMQYLHEHGYMTLTSEQYVSIMETDVGDTPEKPILLTFDDATPDFYLTTLPILERFQMNAVLFVVTDWIDGDYCMSKSQLLDIVGHHPNISIENHSANHIHHAWNTMEVAEASAELAKANEYIHEITGKNPVLFAYPYGQYNEAAQIAAANNGIKYSFVVGYPNKGNHEMGRHYVKMETTVDEIVSWI